MACLVFGFWGNLGWIRMVLEELGDGVLSFGLLDFLKLGDGVNGFGILGKFGTFGVACFLDVLDGLELLRLFGNFWRIFNFGRVEL